MLSKLVAKRYARALLSAAVAKSVIERVETDLFTVVAAIKKERGIAKFLADPKETPGAKKELLGKAFAGILPETLNFLSLLVDKKRFDYLPEILSAYSEEADRIRGIAVAKVKSAQALQPDAMAAISKRLKEITGKEIELVTEIDPSIVGGVLIRVGNKIIDATLARQLEDLRSAIALGNPLSSEKRRVRRVTKGDKPTA
jgi:F-type H+-transporting ATPase subunit delta